MRNMEEVERISESRRPRFEPDVDNAPHEI